jgi:hypothetical protein
MDCVSIRSITGDIARLTGFDPEATGVPASWSSEDFAELRTSCAALATGSTGAVPPFAPAPPPGRPPHRDHRVPRRRHGWRAPEPGRPRRGFVTEPAAMPWGNQSLLFRDPGGNLVNFSIPVTPVAIEKFAR